MQYKVAVEWTVAGEFEVEAKSLEAAIALVEDGDPPYDGLPSNGEYVDDSFQINKEITKEIN